MAEWEPSNIIYYQGAEHDRVFFNGYDHEEAWMEVDGELACVWKKSPQLIAYISDDFNYLIYVHDDNSISIHLTWYIFQVEMPSAIYFIPPNRKTVKHYVLSGSGCGLIVTNSGYGIYQSPHALKNFLRIKAYEEDHTIENLTVHRAHSILSDRNHYSYGAYGDGVVLNDGNYLIPMSQYDAGYYYLTASGTRQLEHVCYMWGNDTDIYLVGTKPYSDEYPYYTFTNFSTDETHKRLFSARVIGSDSSYIQYKRTVIEELNPDLYDVDDIMTTKRTFLNVSTPYEGILDDIGERRCPILLSAENLLICAIINESKELDTYVFNSYTGQNIVTNLKFPFFRDPIEDTYRSFTGIFGMYYNTESKTYVIYGYEYDHERPTSEYFYMLDVVLYIAKENDLSQWKRKVILSVDSKEGLFRGMTEKNGIFYFLLQGVLYKTSLKGY